MDEFFNVALSVEGFSQGNMCMVPLVKEQEKLMYMVLKVRLVVTPEAVGSVIGRNTGGVSPVQCTVSRSHE